MVDPRRTATAGKADLCLQLAPTLGYGNAFAYASAEEIKEFLNPRTGYY